LMWIIIQGIGAADYIWKEGITAIQTGEAYAGLPDPNAAIFLAAQTVFTSHVCSIQAGLLNLKGGVVRKTSKEYQYGVNKINPRDVCGSLSFNVKDDDKYKDDVNAALTNFNDTLRDAAEKFVEAYNVGMLNTDDASEEDTEEADATFDTELSQVKSQIQTAVIMYYAAMATIESKSKPDLSDSEDKVLEQAKEQGWIMAGMYYFTVSKAQNMATGYKMSAPKTTPASDHMPQLYSSLGEENYEILQATLNVAMDTSTSEEINYQSTSKVADVFVKELGGMQKAFAKLVGAFTDAMTGGADPLLEISHFGSILASAALLAWLVFSAVMVGMSFGMGIMCSISSLCLVMETLTAMVVTPLLILVAALVVQGLIMEFYLPMIPYLVFTMSAIGWMTLVIEAMIAAPMLALGILHPEGQHPIWGRAESGIMIVAGVFLRPALMIVGLFTAIGFSRVAITLVNAGFGPVAGSILPNSGWGGLTFLAGFAMMMGIYVTFVTAVFNRVFSLIYILPDRIMRWVGGAAEQSSVEQDMQSTAGGAAGAAGTVSAMGDSANQELKGGMKEKMSQMQTAHGQGAAKKAGAKSEAATAAADKKADQKAAGKTLGEVAKNLKPK
jgi:conjugal transfer/type IV secretion protein DotA/TraY